MKRLFLLLLVLSTGCSISAQEAKTYTKSDTLRGQQIVDQYLDIIDFDRLLVDSMIYIETKIVDRSNPTDTMRVHQWYANGRRSRIEMYQNGQLESGYYCNGLSGFRMFHSGRRAWVDLIQSSYYDYVYPLDPRGALFDWRSKGSEIVYDGETRFNGNDVERIFVTSPSTFDRYYFFEKNTGLLFLTKEEDHIYGDSKKTDNAQRIDWRGWHQFTPIGSCMVPTEESYQYKDQIVLIFRTYKLIPFNKTAFTEDYYKH